LKIINIGEFLLSAPYQASPNPPKRAQKIGQWRPQQKPSKNKTSLVFFYVFSL